MWLGSFESQTRPMAVWRICWKMTAQMTSERVTMLRFDTSSEGWIRYLSSQRQSDMSSMWKKSETTQYAITINARVTTLSGTPSMRRSFVE